MKHLVPALVAIGCLSLSHAESFLLEVGEADTGLVLLDRDRDGTRASTVVPPSERPGDVMVQYPNDPPDDWTNVCWVIRFPLPEIKGRTIQQARLYLWAQVEGIPPVDPVVEVINGGQSDRIEASDRTADALGDKMAFPFPRTSGAFDIDVTDLVNHALRENLAYVAFRFSAQTEELLEDDGAKFHFLMGGYHNVWLWPESRSPTLEIEVEKQGD